LEDSYSGKVDGFYFYFLLSYILPLLSEQSEFDWHPFLLSFWVKVLLISISNGGRSSSGKIEMQLASLFSFSNGPGGNFPVWHDEIAMLALSFVIQSCSCSCWRPVSGNVPWDV
jgi:hypothetical protein